MQFHRDIDLSHYVIRRYGPGQVTLLLPGTPGQLAGGHRLREETLTGSVVIMPARVLRDWPPQRLTEATRAHFEAIAALDPELVLLGSGKRLRFPDRGLLAPLSERGIGVEVMDTGAACRTYNILMAEGRAVAAALIMIEAE
jgi:uncharacterized protein